MIRKRPRNEFDNGTGERTGNVLIVPAHINGYMAHGETSGKCSRVIVDDGFKTQTAAHFGGAAEPIITQLVTWLGRVAQIKVSSPPEPISFAQERLIHKATGDLWSRAIQARNHEHTIGRLE